MIDIHCHLLPGVDDGAADEETALSMCRLAAESGTTDLVATPHANHQYKFSPEANEEARRRLEERLGPHPRLHLGCDFRLSFENIEAALADPKRFTINRGPYLLVEFSEQVITHGTSGIFARLGEVGVTAIITHPERNHLLRQDRSRLAAWVEQGCRNQVTGQSLLGTFGSRARDAAISLLDAGLVHVIASDGHDLAQRPPVLAESFAFVADRWGEELARRLFVDNPQAVIEGRGIASRPRVGRRRKWWRIW
jgi:protein-tyrosine phosphatase